MARKRKCKWCGTYTEDYIVTPVAAFCGTDCAIEYANKAKNKAREKQLAKARQSQARKVKDANKAHRERKAALKPKSKHLAEAQSAFNKYIRLRDYHEPCISCGKSREEIESAQGWKIGGAWDAGHFQTRGAKGQLRFVLFNVHKQCKSCNAGGGKFSHKAATVDEQYRKNLINKIGLEKVEWLENNNEIDNHKNDIEYLNRIKMIFRKKARILEKRLNNLN